MRNESSHAAKRGRRARKFTVGAVLRFVFRLASMGPRPTPGRKQNALEAVNKYLCTNQLGRRNLKPDQMSYIRGRLYNRRKKRHGAEHGGRGNQHVVSGQSDTLPDTASTIATDQGVSRATVIRDGKRAAGVTTPNSRHSAACIPRSRHSNERLAIRHPPLDIRHAKRPARHPKAQITTLVTILARRRPK